MPARSAVVGNRFHITVLDFLAQCKITVITSR